jgi:hypothetical protein
MYQLSEKQLSSVEDLVEKLDDSMIKARIERWIEKVDPGRVLSEELEEFVGFATHLPKEFQNYPQEFAFNVKNGVDTENIDIDETEEVGKPKRKKSAVNKVVKKTKK